MRDVWNNIKGWLIRLGNEEVQLFGRSIKRSVLLMLAAVIVAGAIAAPIVLTLSNRKVSLKYERTDIDPHAAERFSDGILFYRTGNVIHSINPASSTKVDELPLYVDPDGFEMSSETRLIYAGSSAQIAGQEPFVMGGGETILSGRVGRRYAALLYRNHYDDSRILLVDTTTQPNTRVVATIPIAGGEVTAFGFLQGGSELLWVATVDVNQFSEESIVRVYNCDKDGAMIFYSSSFYNQTIEDVALTNHCLYLIGTQDLVRYDRTTEGFSSERDRVSIYGGHVTSYTEAADGASAYFIVMPDTTADQPQRLYRLLTVSQSDESWATVLQQFMPAPIVSVFLQDNRVNVVTTKAFEQYTYAGKSQLSIELDETPVRVIPCAGSFLLYTDSVVYRATVE